MVAATSVKSCTKCGLSKPLERFKQVRAGRQKDGPLRYAAECKDCGTARVAKWNLNNPDRYKEHRKREKDRLRQALRTERELALGKPVRCEICGRGFVAAWHRGPQFDHNHGTDAARGWLCNGCNSGLGALGDNPRILRAAAEYLEKRGHAQTRPRIR